MSNAMRDRTAMAPIQKILIAIDGSHHATRAVRLGAMIAAAQSAQVTLLHVLLNGTPYPKICGLAASYGIAAETLEHLRPPSPADYENSMSFPIGMMNAVAPAELLIEIGRGILEAHKDIVGDYGVRDISLMMEDGNPADQIIEIAERETVDMVFLGHRGLGALSEFFMGSVATKVNHLASVSVVSVK